MWPLPTLSFAFGPQDEISALEKVSTRLYIELDDLVAAKEDIEVVCALADLFLQ